MNLKKIAFVIFAISINVCNVLYSNNIYSDQQEKGRLEVICGSMYSGKSEELIRRLKRAEYAKQRVFTIKPCIDNRYSENNIVSHAGRQRSACMMSDQQQDLEKILELVLDNADVIGIDEIQFFSTSILKIIDILIQEGKKVIVAGLDLDFRGEPFGIMPILMAKADEVLKLKAICVSCGKDAQHSQRLINGRPAAYDDPIILVGDMYEARCRNCFVLSKSTNNNL